MFAEVVLSKVTRYLDKIFHYSIPEDLKDKLRVGHQVLVPFGRRRDIGYVVGFVKEAEDPGIINLADRALKPI